MTQRKRVPIQLKGSDEQYFRTREIQARPEPPAAPVVAPKARPEAKPEASPAPKPAAVSKLRPKPKAEGQGRRKAAPPPEAVEPGEGEVVSRIVPLGRTLSKRVQALAEASGVAIDDLLYAARKKAVARFRRMIAGSDRPALPAAEKGGETIRISFKLTPAELGRLNAWFDPLGLGIATKQVAPLLAAALRAEVTAICAAAEQG